MSVRPGQIKNFSRTENPNNAAAGNFKGFHGWLDGWMDGWTDGRWMETVDDEMLVFLRKNGQKRADGSSV